MNGDLQGLFSIKEQNMLTSSNFPIFFFFKQLEKWVLLQKSKNPQLKFIQHNGSLYVLLFVCKIKSIYIPYGYRKKRS